MKKLPNEIVNDNINTIEDLETFRKKIVKTESIYSLIFVAIGSVVLAITRSPYFAIIILFIALFFIALVTANSKKKFNDAYKRLIVLEVFKKVFPKINYEPNKGLDLKVIENTNMIISPDRYCTNDYISATYNDINFETADIHLEESYKDKDGNTHYKTIFQGQWYIFDFKSKSFKSDIQIIENSFCYSRRSGWFTDSFNQIQLEDIEFNNTFSVFAKNDLDAFYILTPAIMERIKLLNKRIPGDLIFCFKNSKLHIGVNNRRDSYEPSIYKSINLEEAEQSILSELNDIIEFINYLQLDKTLFRKEV